VGRADPRVRPEPSINLDDMKDQVAVLTATVDQLWTAGADIGNMIAPWIASLLAVPVDAVDPLTRLRAPTSGSKLAQLSGQGAL
jgi:hypothetical protein